MLFISKNSWLQRLRTFPSLFICKLFTKQVGQNKSYGVSTGLVHVKTIAVFITYFWLKPCSATYAMEIPK